ncbi:MAG: transglutaminase domain-containing protein, partial [Methanofastidiosum sp.]
MKKYIIILILIALTLTGCGIYNLNSFILPDDLEFIQTIEQLDTPEKIGQYIYNNFTYEAHPYNVLSPYSMWKTKKGDCNDISTFAVFVANYHGYKTYQVFFYGDINHAIAVFIEDGQYTYISDNKYYPIDFRENINN